MSPVVEAVALLVVAVGNIGGARKTALGRFLRTDAGRPHVIVLTEAYKLRRFGKRWAKKHGYWYRQYGRRRGAEAPGIAILIDKREAGIGRRDLIRMRAVWWWGRSRDRLRRRQPRRFVELLLELKGWPDIEFAAFHFAPGGPQGAKTRTGGKNRKSWRESARWARNFLADVGIQLGAGDVNASRREVLNHIANPADSRYARTGKVDGVLSNGVKHEDTYRIRGKNLPGHGWGVQTYSR